MHAMAGRPLGKYLEQEESFRIPFLLELLFKCFADFRCTNTAIARRINGFDPITCSCTFNDATTWTFDDAITWLFDDATTCSWTFNDAAGIFQLFSNAEWVRPTPSRLCRGQPWRLHPVWLVVLQGLHRPLVGLFARSARSLEQTMCSHPVVTLCATPACLCGLLRREIAFVEYHVTAPTWSECNDTLFDFIISRFLLNFYFQFESLNVLLFL